MAKTRTPGELIDRACAALGFDAFTAGLQLLPARNLDLSVAPPLGNAPHDVAPVLSWAEQQGVGSYQPPLLPYPMVPTRPALLCNLHEASLEGLRAGLLLRYPASYSLTLLAEDNSQQPIVLQDLVLAARSLQPAALLYLPALPPEANVRSPEGPMWVAARLLGPAGCPWDVRQTHRSLRAGLLEEAFEVLEALDSGDDQGLVEELGDLLLQSLFHAEIARQAGSFEIGDVYAALAGKLINRHPHVFGTPTVAGSGEVLRNWESIKGHELAAKGRARTSALDGVPPALPALATAQKLVRKAARVGFDWPDQEAVWVKLHEELNELTQAAAQSDAEHTAEELGDLLFALVNLARWLELDAETALREANVKFRRRFGAIEQAAQVQGRELRTLNLAEMLALWNEAKNTEE